MPARTFIRFFTWLYAIEALGQIAAARYHPFAITPLQIVESDSGMTWLACPEGLYRFDGLNYLRPSPADEGIRRAIEHPIAIAGSPRGELFIATANGAILYERGEFSWAARGRPVHDVAMTGDGIAVIHAGSGEVLTAVRNVEGWSYRQQPHLRLTGLMTHDASGAIWSQDAAGRPVSIPPGEAQRDAARDGRLRTSPAPFRTDGLPGPIIQNVPAGSERHWVWTATELIGIHPRDGIKRIPVAQAPIAGIAPRLAQESSGDVHVPAARAYVISDGADQLWDPYENLRMTTSAVSLFRGRLGWIGFHGGGLSRDEPGVTADGPTGKFPVRVASVAIDFGGRIVMATGKGFQPFTDQRPDIRHLGSGRQSANVLDVLPLPDGTYWTLPWTPNGLPLERVDAEGRVVERLTPHDKQIRTDDFRDLARDGSGRIWVGSKSGLYYLTGTTLAPVKLPGQQRLSDALQVDQAGGLWSIYLGGICKVRGVECEPVITNREGLLSPQLRTFALNADASEVYVGYRDDDVGFSRFRRDGEGWLPTHFRTRDGYPSSVTVLRRDSRGWIWLGNGDGMYVSDGVRLDPADWVRLSADRYLPDNDVTLQGFLEDPSGTVWIGTEKGVVTLRPRPEWFAADRPAITAVGAGGGRQFLADPPASISSGSGFVIHATHSGPRPLRRRLLPLETKWTVTDDGTARYEQLPAGAYRFQVSTGTDEPVEYAFHVISSWTGALPWFLPISAGAIWGSTLAWRRVQYWRAKQAYLRSANAPEVATAEALGEAVDPEDLSGQAVQGGLVLKERLGRGGFADVYLATGANGGHSAIKVLHAYGSHQAWRRKRFAQECEALTRVAHPGIVKLHGFGVLDCGRPYLVMDYIEGETLRTMIRRGPLPTEQAARVIEDVGDAVGHAHTLGILHRDLKPENVMIRSSDGAAVLVDFGIATIHDEEGPGSRSSTRVAGSLPYLAPEQLMGEASRGTDVFALALLTFEMLTGSPLATFGYGVDVDRKLRELRPDAAEALGLVLGECLRYEPDARPADAAALGQRLAALIRLG